MHDPAAYPRAANLQSPISNLQLFRDLRRMRTVFLEHARRRKFAETMAHHVFRDEHRVENFAVVNRKGQADEIRSDHRAARPGLDWRLRFGLFGLDDLLHQVAINERSFFN